MNQVEQYLRVLMYIAAADNDISCEELACFSEIAAANGLQINITDQIKSEIDSGIVDINTTLSDIYDEGTKVQLVKDLLTICFADNNYSLAEQNAIRDICAAIGFGPKKLSQLERESKIVCAMHKVNGTVKGAFATGTAETVAFGKKAISGGNSIVHSVSGGLNSVGAKIHFTLESAKKAKEENKELREHLKKDTLTEAIKQRVIVQLGTKIACLTEQLQEEKKRNMKNEELIQALQSQLDDLVATMEVAQNARTA